ncbi:MAG: RNA-binding protein [Polyangiaceae bacterium]
MSTAKLFVGGLAWATDTPSLREAFESFGEIAEAVVVTERDTGRSRGFGFVTFNEVKDAESAKTSMDGAELDGRNIRVDFAQERSRGGGGGGGRGGGGGGYGGGGGGGGYGGGGGGDSYGGGGSGGSGGGGGGGGGYDGGRGGGRGGRGGGRGGGSRGGGSRGGSDY